MPSEDHNKEVEADIAFQSLKNALDQLDIGYDATSEGRALYIREEPDLKGDLSFLDEHGRPEPISDLYRTDYFLALDSSSGTVTLYSLNRLFRQPAADMQPELAIAICAANDFLRRGSLILDTEKNAFSFRVSDNFIQSPRDNIDLPLLLNYYHHKIFPFEVGLYNLANRQISLEQFLSLPEDYPISNAAYRPRRTKDSVDNVYWDLIQFLDYDPDHTVESFERTDDMRLVQISPYGMHFPVLLAIRFFPRLHAARLHAAFPFQIPEERRVEAAIAVCEISKDLACGELVYDLPSGSVAFQISEEIWSSHPGADMFRLLTGRPVLDTLDSCFNRMQKLILE